MLVFIIFMTALLCALGAGFLAAQSDVRGLTIPNSFSLVIIIAFVSAYVALALSGQGALVFSNIISHLIAALIVFGVTAAMFFMGGLGAADSKMGTVFALWVGVKGLFPFLFYMALCGGVLALSALVLQKKKLINNPVEGSWVARVQAGESKVPYGVAIVCGALIAFVKLGYFNPALYVELLQ